MKIGDIGYVSTLLSFILDENKKLWIASDTTISMLIEDDSSEKNTGEKEEIPLLGIMFSENLKIEKVEGGYKLYLYEFFDFLREKHFTCSSFGDCSNNEKKSCFCAKTIDRNLFKVSTLPKNSKGEFLAVTAFDTPKRKLNDPVYLDNLNVQQLESFDEKDLQQLLHICTEEERYPLARLVTNELDRRKS